MSWQGDHQRAVNLVNLRVAKPPIGADQTAGEQSLNESPRTESNAIKCIVLRAVFTCYPGKL